MLKVQLVLKVQLARLAHKVQLVLKVQLERQALVVYQVILEQ